MTTNEAAWQPFQKAATLKVGTAPYTPASGDMVVVKNAAVAINPIDWLVQSRGDIMFTYLKYPFILGSDIAGEVVEVGKDVSRFHIGDRVLGLGRASSKDINDPAQGGFQHYCLIHQKFLCAIPSGLSYESASVIPLAFATAQLPARPATGKTLIVWGGSTSVGCNAIPLAIAAGYEVFSTSSPKNFEYLKSLGASRVFDYRSPTVVDNMIRALKGKITAGALSIGSGAAEHCMKILDKSSGDKFVSMATFPVPEKEPQVLVLPRTAAYFISWLIAYKFKGMMKGIKSNLIDINPVINSGIGKHVFEDFLPSALRAGSFFPAPQSEVVGHGLESVQEGFNLQRKGVSAKKLVITL